MTMETGEQAPSTVDDASVQALMKKGDEVDEDVTCDSAFMLETMPNVAQTMRD